MESGFSGNVLANGERLKFGQGEHKTTQFAHSEIGLPSCYCRVRARPVMCDTCGILPGPVCGESDVPGIWIYLITFPLSFTL